MTTVRGGSPLLRPPGGARRDTWKNRIPPNHFLPLSGPPLLGSLVTEGELQEDAPLMRMRIVRVGHFQSDPFGPRLLMTVPVAEVVVVLVVVAWHTTVLWSVTAFLQTP